MKKVSLPRIYIKDRVIFPNMIFSIVLKEKESIEVLDSAYKNNSHIFTVLKTDAKRYQIGTITAVLGFSKAKDGYVALLYGISKAIELEHKAKESLVQAISVTSSVDNLDKYEFELTYDRVIDILKKFQEVSEREILDANFFALLSQLSPEQVINIITTKLNMLPDLAQEIYEMNDVLLKLNRLYFAILDQIRTIINLSEYTELPDEIKNILLFMNTASDTDDSLLVLGFVINDYLKHKELNKEQTKAIQELRKSLLLNANSGIIN